MEIRATLRRWHMWLGWLVGIPLLVWTVSGLVMVARPIEEVRGTALLADPAPLAVPKGAVVPPLAGRPLRSLTLERRASGPRWVLRFADGGAGRLADPTSGRLLPAYGPAEASREVMARYRGKARIASAHRVDADDPPIELRRNIDAWRVRMTDGTHFFVDAGTGEIVARRTRFWRLYDFMWGLHIMDLEGREQPHNPWVVTFAALAILMVVMALILLPLASRRSATPPAGARRIPPRKR